MKHRAIKDLSQVRQENLVSEISTGLSKVYENSLELWTSARSLFESKNYRGYRVLEAFAREEAAKYLILLDALRCPLPLFASQLQKFNEHLANGIYSKTCDWRPDSYRCLREYVDSELDQFYLDGPNGIEWIFRNDIISSREECIYVDYVAYDSDNHEWITPRAKDRYSDLFPHLVVPGVIRVIQALRSTGIEKAEALKIYAEYWRNFSFDDSTHHHEFRQAFIEFIKLLDNAGLLENVQEKEISILLEQYPYPLYREAMKENKVSTESLKERQENWSPEW